MAAVVQPPAPQQPVSSFPILPPVGHADLYSSLIASARKGHTQHYANYNTAADLILPLAAEWGARHAQIIAGTAEPKPSADEITAEINTKVGTYCTNRRMRDNTERILALYDKVIAECEDQSLDPATLVKFLKLKIKLSDLKTPYDRAFGVGVPQLKAQRELIFALGEKLKPSVKALSTSLEPLVAFSQGYTGVYMANYLALKAYHKSHTPLVKLLVAAHEAAAAVAQDEAAPEVAELEVVVPGDLVSTFPVLPDVTEAAYYATHIDRARKEYNDHYVALKGEADKVAAIAQDWEKHHTAISDGTLEPMPTHVAQEEELNRKIDRCIQLYKVRDDVLKIIGIYDQEIAYCSDATLDEATLKRLQKLGVDPVNLKGPFDQVFTTDLAQLRDQRAKFVTMHEKMLFDLSTLEVSLEILAVHVKKCLAPVHAGMKLAHQSQTPFVKQMVAARQQALAIILA
jgi:hypothetical protein